MSSFKIQPEPVKLPTIIPVDCLVFNKLQTAPSSTPPQGGMIYSDSSGFLVFKSESGIITIIANN